MPGYDLLLQAMSGLMSVTGEPDGRPLKVGAALIDMVCGLSATNGILAALHARERTGRGQHVEVSLMDSALHSLLNQASGFLGRRASCRAGSATATRRSRRTRRSAPGDGEIAVACGNDAIFARLCERARRSTRWSRTTRFSTNAARLAQRRRARAR